MRTKADFTPEEEQRYTEEKFSGYLGVNRQNYVDGVPGHDTNCLESTIAGAKTHFDPEGEVHKAKPAPPEGEPLKKLEDQYGPAYWVSDRSVIDQYMRFQAAAGKGYGHVRYNTAKGGAHVITVLRDPDGDVTYFDMQRGAVPSLDGASRFKFQPVNGKTTIAVARPGNDTPADRPAAAEDYVADGSPVAGPSGGVVASAERDKLAEVLDTLPESPPGYQETPPVVDQRMREQVRKAGREAAGEAAEALVATRWPTVGPALPREEFAVAKQRPWASTVAWHAGELDALRREGTLSRDEIAQLRLRALPMVVPDTTMSVAELGRTWPMRHVLLDALAHLIHSDRAHEDPLARARSFMDAWRENGLDALPPDAAPEHAGTAGDRAHAALDQQFDAALVPRVFAPEALAEREQDAAELAELPEDQRRVVERWTRLLLPDPSPGSGISGRLLALGREAIAHELVRTARGQNTPIGSVDLLGPVATVARRMRALITPGPAAAHGGQSAGLPVNAGAGAPVVSTSVVSYESFVDYDGLPAEHWASEYQHRKFPGTQEINRLNFEVANMGVPGSVGYTINCVWATIQLINTLAFGYTFEAPPAPGLLNGWRVFRYLLPQLSYKVHTSKQSIEAYMLTQPRGSLSVIIGQEKENSKIVHDFAVYRHHLDGSIDYIDAQPGLPARLMHYSRFFVLDSIPVRNPDDLSRPGIPAPLALPYFSKSPGFGGNSDHNPGSVGQGMATLPAEERAFVNWMAQSLLRAVSVGPGWWQGSDHDAVANELVASAWRQNIPIGSRELDLNSAWEVALTAAMIAGTAAPNGGVGELLPANAGAGMAPTYVPNASASVRAHSADTSEPLETPFYQEESGANSGSSRPGTVIDVSGTESEDTVVVPANMPTEQFGMPAGAADSSQRLRDELAVRAQEAAADLAMLPDGEREPVERLAQLLLPDPPPAYRVSDVLLAQGRQVVAQVLVRTAWYQRTPISSLYFDLNPAWEMAAHVDDLTGARRGEYRGGRRDVLPASQHGAYALPASVGSASVLPYVSFESFVASDGSPDMPGMLTYSRQRFPHALAINRSNYLRAMAGELGFAGFIHNCVWTSIQLANTIAFESEFIASPTAVGLMWDETFMHLFPYLRESRHTNVQSIVWYMLSQPNGSLSFVLASNFSARSRHAFVVYRHHLDGGIDFFDGQTGISTRLGGYDVFHVLEPIAVRQQDNPALPGIPAPLGLPYFPSEFGAGSTALARRVFAPEALAEREQDAVELAELPEDQRRVVERWTRLLLPDPSPGSGVSGRLLALGREAIAHELVRTARGQNAPIGSVDLPGPVATVARRMRTLITPGPAAARGGRSVGLPMNVGSGMAPTNAPASVQAHSAHTSAPTVSTSVVWYESFVDHDGQPAEHWASEYQQRKFPGTQNINRPNYQFAKRGVPGYVGYTMNCVWATIQLINTLAFGSTFKAPPTSGSLNGMRAFRYLFPQRSFKVHESKQSIEAYMRTQPWGSLSVVCASASGTMFSHIFAVYRHHLDGSIDYFDAQSGLPAQLMPFDWFAVLDSVPVRNPDDPSQSGILAPLVLPYFPTAQGFGENPYHTPGSFGQGMAALSEEERAVVNQMAQSLLRAVSVGPDGWQGPYRDAVANELVNSARRQNIPIGSHELNLNSAWEVALTAAMLAGTAAPNGGVGELLPANAGAGMAPLSTGVSSSQPPLEGGVRAGSDGDNRERRALEKKFFALREQIGRDVQVLDVTDFADLWARVGNIDDLSDVPLDQLRTGVAMLSEAEERSDKARFEQIEKTYHAAVNDPSYKPKFYPNDIPGSVNSRFPLQFGPELEFVILAKNFGQYYRRANRLSGDLSRAGHLSGWVEGLPAGLPIAPDRTGKLMDQARKESELEKKNKWIMVRELVTRFGTELVPWILQLKEPGTWKHFGDILTGIQRHPITFSGRGGHINLSFRERAAAPHEYLRAAKINKAFEALLYRLANYTDGTQRRIWVVGPNPFPPARVESAADVAKLSRDKHDGMNFGNADETGQFRREDRYWAADGNAWVWQVRTEISALIHAAGMDSTIDAELDSLLDEMPMLLFSGRAGLPELVRFLRMVPVSREAQELILHLFAATQPWRSGADNDKEHRSKTMNLPEGGFFFPVPGMSSAEISRISRAVKEPSGAEVFIATVDGGDISRIVLMDGQKVSSKEILFNLWRRDFGLKKSPVFAISNAAQSEWFPEFVRQNFVGDYAGFSRHPIMAPHAKSTIDDETGELLAVRDVVQDGRAISELDPQGWVAYFCDKENHITSFATHEAELSRALELAREYSATLEWRDDEEEEKTGGRMSRWLDEDGDIAFGHDSDPRAELAEWGDEPFLSESEDLPDAPGDVISSDEEDYEMDDSDVDRGNSDFDESLSDAGDDRELGDEVVVLAGARSGRASAFVPGGSVVAPGVSSALGRGAYVGEKLGRLVSGVNRANYLRGLAGEKGFSGYVINCVWATVQLLNSLAFDRVFEAPPAPDLMDPFEVFDDVIPGLKYSLYADERLVDEQVRGRLSSWGSACVVHAERTGNPDMHTFAAYRSHVDGDLVYVDAETGLRASLSSFSRFYVSEPVQLRNPDDLSGPGQSAPLGLPYYPGKPGARSGSAYDDFSDTDMSDAFSEDDEAVDETDLSSIDVELPLAAQAVRPTSAYHPSRFDAAVGVWKLETERSSGQSQLSSGTLEKLARFAEEFADHVASLLAENRETPDLRLYFPAIWQRYGFRFGDFERNLRRAVGNRGVDPEGDWLNFDPIAGPGGDQASRHAEIRVHGGTHATPESYVAARRLDVPFIGWQDAPSKAAQRRLRWMIKGLVSRVLDNPGGADPGEPTRLVLDLRTAEERMAARTRVISALVNEAVRTELLLRDSPLTPREFITRHVVLRRDATSSQPVLLADIIGPPHALDNVRTELPKNIEWTTGSRVTESAPAPLSDHDVDDPVGFGVGPANRDQRSVEQSTVEQGRDEEAAGLSGDSLEVRLQRLSAGEPVAYGDFRSRGGPVFSEDEAGRIDQAAVQLTELFRQGHTAVDLQVRLHGPHEQMAGIHEQMIEAIRGKFKELVNGHLREAGFPASSIDRLTLYAARDVRTEAEVGDYGKWELRMQPTVPRQPSVARDHADDGAREMSGASTVVRVPALTAQLEREAGQREERARVEQAEQEARETAPDLEPDGQPDRQADPAEDERPKLAEGYFPVLNFDSVELAGAEIDDYGRKLASYINGLDPDTVLPDIQIFAWTKMRPGTKEEVTRAGQMSPQQETIEERAKVHVIERLRSAMLAAGLDSGKFERLPITWMVFYRSNKKNFVGDGIVTVQDVDPHARTENYYRNAQELYFTYIGRKREQKLSVATKERLLLVAEGFVGEFLDSHEDLRPTLDVLVSKKYSLVGYRVAELADLMRRNLGRVWEGLGRSKADPLFGIMCSHAKVVKAAISGGFTVVRTSPAKTATFGPETPAVRDETAEGDNTSRDGVARARAVDEDVEDLYGATPEAEGLPAPTAAAAPRTTPQLAPQLDGDQDDSSSSPADEESASERVDHGDQGDRGAEPVVERRSEVSGVDSRLDDDDRSVRSDHEDSPRSPTSDLGSVMERWEPRLSPEAAETPVPTGDLLDLPAEAGPGEPVTGSDLVPQEALLSENHSDAEPMAAEDQVMSDAPSVEREQDMVEQGGDDDASSLSSEEHGRMDYANLGLDDLDFGDGDTGSPSGEGRQTVEQGRDEETEGPSGESEMVTRDLVGDDAREMSDSLSAVRDSALTAQTVWEAEERARVEQAEREARETAPEPDDQAGQQVDPAEDDRPKRAEGHFHTLDVDGARLIGEDIDGYGRKLGSYIKDLDQGAVLPDVEIFVRTSLPLDGKKKLTRRELMRGVAQPKTIKEIAQYHIVERLRRAMSDGGVDDVTFKRLPITWVIRRVFPSDPLEGRVTVRDVGPYGWVEDDYRNARKLNLHYVFGAMEKLSVATEERLLLVVDGFVREFLGSQQGVRPRLDIGVSGKYVSVDNRVEDLSKLVTRHLGVVWKNLKRNESDPLFQLLRDHMTVFKDDDLQQGIRLVRTSPAENAALGSGAPAAWDEAAEGDSTSGDGVVEAQAVEEEDLYDATPEPERLPAPTAAAAPRTTPQLAPQLDGDQDDSSSSPADEESASERVDHGDQGDRGAEPVVERRSEVSGVDSRLDDDDRSVRSDHEDSPRSPTSDLGSVMERWEPRLSPEAAETPVPTGDWSAGDLFDAEEGLHTEGLEERPRYDDLSERIGSPFDDDQDMSDAPSDERVPDAVEQVQDDDALSSSPDEFDDEARWGKNYEYFGLEDMNLASPGNPAPVGQADAPAGDLGEQSDIDFDFDPMDLDFGDIDLIGLDRSADLGAEPSVQEPAASEPVAQDAVGVTDTARSDASVADTALTSAALASAAASLPPSALARGRIGIALQLSPDDHAALLEAARMIVRQVMSRNRGFTEHEGVDLQFVVRVNSEEGDRFQRTAEVVRAGTIAEVLRAGSSRALRQALDELYPADRFPDRPAEWQLRPTFILSRGTIGTAGAWEWYLRDSRVRTTDSYRAQSDYETRNNNAGAVRVIDRNRIGWMAEGFVDAAVRAPADRLPLFELTMNVPADQLTSQIAPSRRFIEGVVRNRLAQYPAGSTGLTVDQVLARVRVRESIIESEHDPRLGLVEVHVEGQRPVTGPFGPAASAQPGGDAANREPGSQPGVAGRSTGTARGVRLDRPMGTVENPAPLAELVQQDSPDVDLVQVPLVDASGVVRGVGFLPPGEAEIVEEAFRQGAGEPDSFSVVMHGEGVDAAGVVRLLKSSGEGWLRGSKVVLLSCRVGGLGSGDVLGAVAGLVREEGFAGRVLGPDSAVEVFEDGAVVLPEGGEFVSIDGDGVRRVEPGRDRGPGSGRSVRLMDSPSDVDSESAGSAAAPDAQSRQAGAPADKGGRAGSRGGRSRRGSGRPEPASGLLSPQWTARPRATSADPGLTSRPEFSAATGSTLRDDEFSSPAGLTRAQTLASMPVVLGKGSGDRVLRAALDQPKVVGTPADGRELRKQVSQFTGWTLGAVAAIKELSDKSLGELVGSGKGIDLELPDFSVKVRVVDVGTGDVASDSAIEDDEESVWSASYESRPEDTVSVESRERKPKVNPTSVASAVIPPTVAGKFGLEVYGLGKETSSSVSNKTTRRYTEATSEQRKSSLSRHLVAYEVIVTPRASRVPFRQRPEARVWVGQISLGLEWPGHSVPVEGLPAAVLLSYTRESHHEKSRKSVQRGVFAGTTDVRDRLLAKYGLTADDPVVKDKLYPWLDSLGPRYATELINGGVVRKTFTFGDLGEVEVAIGIAPRAGAAELWTKPMGVGMTRIAHKRDQSGEYRMSHGRSDNVGGKISDTFGAETHGVQDLSVGASASYRKSNADTRSETEVMGSTWSSAIRGNFDVHDLVFDYVVTVTDVRKSMPVKPVDPGEGKQDGGAVSPATRVAGMARLWLSRPGETESAGDSARGSVTGVGGNRPKSGIPDDEVVDQFQASWMLPTDLQESLIADVLGPALQKLGAGHQLGGLRVRFKEFLDENAKELFEEGDPIRFPLPGGKDLFLGGRLDRGQGGGKGVVEWRELDKKLTTDETTKLDNQRTKEISLQLVAEGKIGPAKLGGDFTVSRKSSRGGAISRTVGLEVSRSSGLADQDSSEHRAGDVHKYVFPGVVRARLGRDVDDLDDGDSLWETSGDAHVLVLKRQGMGMEVDRGLQREETGWMDAGSLDLSEELRAELPLEYDLEGYKPVRHLGSTVKKLLTPVETRGRQAKAGEAIKRLALGAKPTALGARHEGDEDTKNASRDGVELWASSDTRVVRTEVAARASDVQRLESYNDEGFVGSRDRIGTISLTTRYFNARIIDRDDEHFSRQTRKTQTEFTTSESTTTSGTGTVSTSVDAGGKATVGGEASGGYSRGPVRSVLGSGATESTDTHVGRYYLVEVDEFHTAEVSVYESVTGPFGDQHPRGSTTQSKEKFVPAAKRIWVAASRMSEVALAGRDLDNLADEDRATYLAARAAASSRTGARIEEQAETQAEVETEVGEQTESSSDRPGGLPEAVERGAGTWGAGRADLVREFQTRLREMLTAWESTIPEAEAREKFKQLHDRMAEDLGRTLSQGGFDSMVQEMLGGGLPLHGERIGDSGKLEQLALLKARKVGGRHLDTGSQHGQHLTVKTTRTRKRGQKSNWNAGASANAMPAIPEFTGSSLVEKVFGPKVGGERKSARDTTEDTGKQFTTTFRWAGAAEIYGAELEIELELLPHARSGTYRQYLPFLRRNPVTGAHSLGDFALSGDAVRYREPVYRPGNDQPLARVEGSAREFWNELRNVDGYPGLPDSAVVLPTRFAAPKLHRWVRDHVDEMNSRRAYALLLGTGSGQVREQFRYTLTRDGFVTDVDSQTIKSVAIKSNLTDLRLWGEIPGASVEHEVTEPGKTAQSVKDDTKAEANVLTETAAGVLGVGGVSKESSKKAVGGMESSTSAVPKHSGKVYLVSAQLNWTLTRWSRDSKAAVEEHIDDDGRIWLRVNEAGLEALGFDVPDAGTGVQEVRGEDFGDLLVPESPWHDTSDPASSTGPTSAPVEHHPDELDESADGHSSDLLDTDEEEPWLDYQDLDKLALATPSHPSSARTVDSPAVSPRAEQLGDAGQGGSRSDDQELSVRDNDTRSVGSRESGRSHSAGAAHVLEDLILNVKGPGSSQPGTGSDLLAGDVVPVGELVSGDGSGLVRVPLVDGSGVVRGVGFLPPGEAEVVEEAFRRGAGEPDAFSVVMHGGVVDAAGVVRLLMSSGDGWLRGSKVVLLSCRVGGSGGVLGEVAGLVRGKGFAGRVVGPDSVVEVFEDGVVWLPEGSFVSVDGDGVRRVEPGGHDGPGGGRSVRLMDSPSDVDMESSSDVDMDSASDEGSGRPAKWVWNSSFGAELEPSAHTAGGVAFTNDVSELHGWSRLHRAMPSQATEGGSEPFFVFVNGRDSGFDFDGEYVTGAQLAERLLRYDAYQEAVAEDPELRIAVVVGAVSAHLGGSVDVLQEFGDSLREFAEAMRGSGPYREVLAADRPDSENPHEGVFNRVSRLRLSDVQWVELIGADEKTYGVGFPSTAEGATAWTEGAEDSTVYSRRLFSEKADDADEQPVGTEVVADWAGSIEEGRAEPLHLKGQAAGGRRVVMLDGSEKQLPVSDEEFTELALATSVFAAAQRQKVRPPLVITTEGLFAGKTDVDPNVGLVAALTELAGPWHSYSAAASQGIFGQPVMRPGERFTETPLTLDDVRYENYDAVFGFPSGDDYAADRERLEQFTEAVAAGRGVRGPWGGRKPIFVSLDGATSHGNLGRYDGQIAEEDGKRIGELLLDNPDFRALLEEEKKKGSDRRPIVLLSSDGAARVNYGGLGFDVAGALRAAGHFLDVYAPTREVSIGWDGIGLGEDSSFELVSTWRAGDLKTTVLTSPDKKIALQVVRSTGDEKLLKELEKWIARATPESLASFPFRDEYGQVHDSNWHEDEPPVLVVARSTAAGYRATRRDGAKVTLSTEEELAQVLRDDRELRKLMGTSPSRELMLIVQGPARAGNGIEEFAKAMVPGGYSRTMLMPEGPVSFDLPGKLVTLGAVRRADAIAPRPRDLVSYPHVRHDGVVHGQFFPTDDFDAAYDAANGMRYLDVAQGTYYRTKVTQDGKTTWSGAKSPWAGQRVWLTDGHGLGSEGLFFQMVTGRPHVRGDEVMLNGVLAACAIYGSTIFMQAGGSDKILLRHCESNMSTDSQASIAYNIKRAWEKHFKKKVAIWGADQRTRLSASGLTTVKNGGRFAEVDDTGSVGSPSDTDMNSSSDGEPGTSSVSDEEMTGPVRALSVSKGPSDPPARFPGDV
ncbi:hypothetical protein [Amycolatopsis sp. NPDC059021]|uniref:hypothetical protein n=1 Tax=Amycolatopsis sp. NPDC059021 TaxID=3346704 RepID=UPI0036718CEF